MLALCGSARAQVISTAPAIANGIRIDAIDVSVNELRSGRPTLVSTPTFRGQPVFNNGIKFGDGTTQTTAAGGASTVFVAGSSLTITEVTSVIGATVTINNSVRTRGLWSVIASSIPVGGTKEITFSGLVSSVTYKMEYRFAQLSAVGSFEVHFNGDTGNNYEFLGNTILRGVGAQTPTSAATSGCQFHGSATGLSVGTAMIGDFIVGTNPNNTKKVYLNDTHTSWRTAIDVSQFGCIYTGTSDLSSMSISTTAGLLNGEFRLMELVQ